MVGMANVTLCIFYKKLKFFKEMKHFRYSYIYFWFSNKPTSQVKTELKTKPQQIQHPVSFRDFP